MPIVLTDQTVLRRVPQQRRSREKLERVLDAADEVLASEGAAALSMARVAERAGVAVGSIYAYLPDKQSLVEALALAYWTGFSERIEAVVQGEAENPAAEPVELILSSLADGYRSNPGFMALWYGGLRNEAVRDVTRAIRDRVAGAIDLLLIRRYPEAGDPTERTAVADTLVVLGDGLLREAFRRDPGGDPVVLAEGRRALTAYLNSHYSLLADRSPETEGAENGRT